MALDHPEDEVSPLWQVAFADGKYRECPYLQSNRQGQCVRFRHFGPLGCFFCAFSDGLDVGYDMGAHDSYIEGYNDGREDGVNDYAEREEDRYEGMD